MNPAGCLQTGCKKGYLCDTTQGCAPSSCGCDASTGGWTCLTDCGGGVCVPDPETNLCDPAHDPSGCVDKGCPEGSWCDTEQGCAPSTCGCDSETGEWWCTDDCSGGVCVPKE